MSEDSQSYKPKSLEEIKKLSLILPEFQPVSPDIGTTDELLAVIKAYFNKTIETKRLPTMTGLALTLGVTREDLLTAIHSDPEFNRVLTIAKQTIIAYVEELLLSGKAPIGLIFWLKNNAMWIDKQEISHSKGDSISQIIEQLETSSENPLLPASTQQTSPASQDNNNTDTDTSLTSPLESTPSSPEPLTDTTPTYTVNL